MDSPKCLKCFGNGEAGQTYKVAGRALFKCQNCGNLFEQGSFKEIDFKWKQKQSGWYEQTRQKFEKENNKIALDNLEKIKTIQK